MAAAASYRAPTRQREPQSLALEVGLLADSSELGDVELRTHGHRGETAAALALEVVDDGGVTRNRRRAARSSGDDGVGVAGLDTVRRKTVLSTALAATELLGSQRVREHCELRVVKRLARVPEEAVDLGVRRENVLATLAVTHAAQHVGLAALLVQGIEQARNAHSSTWDCRAGRVRVLRFSHLVGSFSQRPLSRCTTHWLRPT